MAYFIQPLKNLITIYINNIILRYLKIQILITMVYFLFCETIGLQSYVKSKVSSVFKAENYVTRNRYGCVHIQDIKLMNKLVPQINLFTLETQKSSQGLNDVKHPMSMSKAPHV